MEKVFIDTDIALDLLSERAPHYFPAAQLFTLADKGGLEIYVSSLSFSNLHYLLSRLYSQAEARRILNTFRILVKVLAVDEKIIDLSLNSTFKDFEDAIQYHTAAENRIDILLTRNLKDYKAAKITVMTAEDYLLSDVTDASENP
jgi:predicted nucleic acid-binding protein